MLSDKEQKSHGHLGGIEWITRAAESVLEPWKFIKSLGRSVSYRIDPQAGILYLSKNRNNHEQAIPLKVLNAKWPYLLDKLGYQALASGYSQRDWTCEDLTESINNIVHLISTTSSQGERSAAAVMAEPSLRQLSKTIHSRPLLANAEELSGTNIWPRRLRDQQSPANHDAITELVDRLGFRDYDHVLDVSSIPCDTGIYIANRFDCSVTLSRKPALLQRMLRQSIRDHDLEQNVVLSKNKLNETKGSFTKIIGIYPYDLHSHSRFKSLIKGISTLASPATKLGFTVFCIGGQQSQFKNDTYDLLSISDLRFPTITGLAATLEANAWHVSRIEETSHFNPFASTLNENARSEPRHALRRRNDFTANTLKALLEQGLISSFVMEATR